MLNNAGAKFGIRLKPDAEFGTQLGVTSSKVEASMDNVEQWMCKAWHKFEAICGVLDKSACELEQS